MNDKKKERESQLSKKEQDWQKLLKRVESLRISAESMGLADIRVQVASLQKVLRTNCATSKTYKSVLNTVEKLETFIGKINIQQVVR